MATEAEVIIQTEKELIRLLLAAESRTGVSVRSLMLAVSDDMRATAGIRGIVDPDGNINMASASVRSILAGRKLQ